MPSISRFCLIHLIAPKSVYCHGVRPDIFHDNSLHVLFWYHSFRCVAHNTDMCIDFFLKILSGRNPSTCAKEEVVELLGDKKNTVMYIPWTFGFLKAVGADRDVCWEALGMCGGIISINWKDHPSIFRKLLYPLFQCTVPSKDTPTLLFMSICCWMQFVRTFIIRARIFIMQIFAWGNQDPKNNIIKS